MPTRIGISFSISGDLRFLSHHDMLRLFARALRRAGLKTVHSQGYNPRPKMWLPLPRPLGVACSDELLVVDLADDLCLDSFSSLLAEQMPDGIKLTGCFRLDTGRVPQPVCAGYELVLSSQQATLTAQRIAVLSASEHLPVERPVKPDGPGRKVDIRPFLKSLSLAGGQLSFKLAYSPSGSAKPAEVLALLGLDEPNHRARLIRKDCQFDYLTRR